MRLFSGLFKGERSRLPNQKEKTDATDTVTVFRRAVGK